MRDAILQLSPRGGDRIPHVTKDSASRLVCQGRAIRRARHIGVPRTAAFLIPNGGQQNNSV
jgi:hypothetical protein